MRGGGECEEVRGGGDSVRRGGECEKVREEVTV